MNIVNMCAWRKSDKKNASRWHLPRQVLSQVATESATDANSQPSIGGQTEKTTVAQETQDSAPPSTGILKTPHESPTSEKVEEGAAFPEARNSLPAKNKTAKRVRFSLGPMGGLMGVDAPASRLKSSEQEETIAEQTDVQMLFSDDDGDEDLGGNLSKQISQLESRLKSDRLRTSRKRKNSSIV